MSLLSAIAASLPFAASQNPCTFVTNDPSAQPAPGPPAAEEGKRGAGGGGGLGEVGHSATNLDSNVPIVVASVPTNPDSAPLGVKGAPLQEDALPSDLPSIMRWLQGDNIEASSLDASRVFERLVAATTKAFAMVQGERRGELRWLRWSSEHPGLLAAQGRPPRRRAASTLSSSPWNEHSVLGGRLSSFKVKSG